MSPAKPRSKASDEGAVPTFEERVEALEAVVEALEAEDLPLETSIERYREGVTHLEACRALLDDAERRLLELVGDGDETRVVEHDGGG